MIIAGVLPPKLLGSRVREPAVVWNFMPMVRLMISDFLMCFTVDDQYHSLNTFV